MAPHVGITGSEIPDRWTQATGLSGLKRPAFAIMNALKREAVESDRKEAQEQAWKQAMMRNAQDEER